MIRSLRTRLLAGTGLVIVLGFSLAGAAVYSISRAALLIEFDKALQANLQALAALTIDGPRGIQLDFVELGFREFDREERPAYFQLWWRDGAELARSPRLGGGQLAAKPGTLASPAIGFTRLPDGRRGRVACATFQPKLFPRADDDDGEDADQVPYTDAGEFGDAARDLKAAPTESGVSVLVWQPADLRLAVAYDTLDLDVHLSRLRWILAAVGAAVAALSLGLLVVAVRKSLFPLHAVTRAIREIDVDSLGDRLALEGVPSEIAPMVARTNELLARLEQAFARERGFSADVAHELRTPLAGLRSTLEVYLSRPHEKDEYRQALQACLAICDQAHELVESLLALARLENRQDGLRIQRFALCELVQACWEALAERARVKGMQVDWLVADTLRLETDREKLRVVLRNLLGNAVHHGNDEGRLTLSAATVSERVEIEVCNTGNQLTESQVSQVFERLWRGDAARTATGEHFGLGLTLSKRLTETLGGTIEAWVRGDDFHVRVSLPVAVGRDSAASR